MTFIRYIGVDFTFGLLNCVRYNEDLVISSFVKLRFCSIHFTVSLAGLKNIGLFSTVYMQSCIMVLTNFKFHVHTGFWKTTFNQYTPLNSTKMA